MHLNELLKDIRHRINSNYQPVASSPDVIRGSIMSQQQIHGVITYVANYMPPQLQKSYVKHEGDNFGWQLQLTNLLSCLFIFIKLIKASFAP